MRHRRRHPRSPGTDPTPRTPSGVHFLTDRTALDTLVRSCAPSPDELVLDLGAGPGAVTAALARTRARVLAIERDPQFVRTLATRFAGTRNVRVLQRDLRDVPLPTRPFVVVANLPYGVSTAVVRRLLGPRRPALSRAALMVEWGFAKRLTAPVPRSRELAWWAARYDIRIVRRVPASAFRPPPAVDSAVVSLRRRRLTTAAEVLLGELLDLAHRFPHRSARALLRQAGQHPSTGVFARCSLPAGTRAAAVAPAAWAALASALSASHDRRRTGM